MVEFWRPVNRHRFEPFYESDGACWCGKGARHLVHRGTRHLLDTPLGKKLYPPASGFSAGGKPAPLEAEEGGSR